MVGLAICCWLPFVVGKTANTKLHFYGLRCLWQAANQSYRCVIVCVCVRLFLEQTVHYVTSDSNASRLRLC